MKVAVVIPTLNEGLRLVETLKKLESLNLSIIVVDDGSTDETEQLLNEFNVIFARHIINRGQGAALKTGTLIAKELGFDAVAHFDADGQHRLEDLQTILKTLDEENHDVVLGSRFMDQKTDFPLQKKVILALAKIFSQRVLKLNFTDPQSGLRAFKLDQLKNLDWKKDDFQHCTEILTLIRRNNLKFKELPIKVVYHDDTQKKVVRPRVSMGLKIMFNKFFE